MQSLEPAIVPKHVPSFLLDWEVTLKCNLDCTYCNSFGHDNSTEHPEFQQCLDTIDFMFEYVDLYMQHKAKWARKVVLNVYGGESLFHPNILDIHRSVKEKYQKYNNNWHLTIGTTTNLIAGENLLSRIVDHIDNFTVSFHAEANEKQKELQRKNILFLKEKQKPTKVVVLMHPEKFQDSLDMIEFCKTNEIDYLPRALDKGPYYVSTSNIKEYDATQVSWFKNLYAEKSNNDYSVLSENDNRPVSRAGRACCGGRQLCTNQNYKERNFFVENNFKGWSCAVNWFFLYIKQYTGNVYTNKDCQMNFDNSVGPIGNLNDTKAMLTYLKDNLENKSLPVIQCDKDVCMCGLCAPKANTIEKFNELFPKYLANV